MCLTNTLKEGWEEGKRAKGGSSATNKDEEGDTAQREKPHHTKEEGRKQHHARSEGESRTTQKCGRENHRKRCRQLRFSQWAESRNVMWIAAMVISM